MRLFITLFFLSSLLLADISPRLMIQASGNVQNIVIHGQNIVAGTSAGTLEVYKISDASLVKKITFEPIKDFTGETIAPKIFSVDALEGSDTFLSVVQASSGARKLVLIEKGIMRELISDKENLFINKAKFIDSNRVLIALMSNELILIDTKSAQKRYQVQINPSHFSDFALNESKSLVASSCESGDCYD